MERYKTLRALVINKKRLRENDLLITLLTPERGKVVVMAKGANSIKSSRLSNLQLGNIIKAQIYEKNGRMWLSEAVGSELFLKYDKNLVQLNLLFYLLEIINNLIAENQLLEGVYEVCEEAVYAVRENQLRRFIQSEIKILNLLGFGLPAGVIESYDREDYKQSQMLIKLFIESIMEKPMESNKLFR